MAADAGRVKSLVVELAAYTAIVDGERIKLPPPEFALLVVLAARPGEIVAHKKLAAEAFGEGVPIAPHELHWRFWKVRGLVGDPERDEKDKLIVNRKGMGYLLDLPADAVTVIEGVAPAQQIALAVEATDPGLEAGEETPEAEEPEGEDLVVVVEHPPSDDEQQNGEDASEVAASSWELGPEVAREPELSPPRRSVASPLTVAIVVALLALGGSWLAGYGLSRLFVSGDSSEPPRATQQPRDRDPDGSEKRSGAQGTKGNEKDGGDTPVAPGSGQQLGGTQAGPSPSEPQPQETSEAQDKDEEPPPAPQPDARLYHLFHPDDGDHFMTISSAAANQKQAAGYQSSVQGGVFSERQNNTVAIALDDGTAFIYEEAGSAPQGTSVRALFRLSKDGDLFHTTSSSEANQAQAQGWSRSTVGYVTA